MQQNLWSLPREAFCWLDDKRVVVVSSDAESENGHCVLLNTVSTQTLPQFSRVSFHGPFRYVLG